MRKPASRERADGAGWTAEREAFGRPAMPVKNSEMVALTRMELAIQIHVEELPEGLFLATSEELPGLVAQGRTVAETLEIARDVARKLIEARRERGAASF